MNNTDKKWLEVQFNEIHRELSSTHDDVLVLKTQRDSAVKFMYFIAGAISLIVSLAVGTLRR